MPDWTAFGQRWFHQPIIVLDLETTGIYGRDPWTEAWDFAALCLAADGAKGERFQALIRPIILDARTEGALRVSGMTPETLQQLCDEHGAVDATQASRDFYSFVERMGLPVTTSFNSDFDRKGIIKMGAPAAACAWGPCIMKTAMAVMGPAGVLRKADPSHPRFDPHRPWLFPKLSDAAQFFSVTQIGDAHRAAADTETAAGIWQALRARVYE